MAYSLRDYIPELDIIYFHEVHSDNDSMRFYGMMPTTSMEESRKLLQTYIDALHKKLLISKVIYDTETMSYCGEIGLFNINHTHHRANSYCILLPTYRKKGISRIISQEFYSYIFSHTKLNRIEAYVDKRNINAKKSLIGIGYKNEGRLLQYEYDRNEYIDIDVYALLKKDFLKEVLC